MPKQPEDVSVPDPRLADEQSRLNALPLTVISGVSFVGQTVYLDGRRFIRCTFRDCTLVTGLGLFEFDGPQMFNGRMSVRLDQPAQYAHELFARLAHGDTGQARHRHRPN